MISILSLNYLFDPYQFYRYNPQKTVLQGNDRWQVAGFIKNFPYNQAIIGTSMTQNFSLTQIKQVLGTEPIKLSIAGATIQEQAVALRAALKTGKLKSVIWGIDKVYLTYQPGKYQESFPINLYSGSYKAHFQYLLDNHVFVASVKALFQEIIKKPKEKINLEEYNTWFNTHTFSKEEVLKQYKKPTTMGISQAALKNTSIDIQTIDKNLVENFNEDVYSIIKSNPDVHFIIFLPPYSLAHYKMSQHDITSLIQAATIREMLMQNLIPLSNVSFFDFETYLPVIENLDNYKDLNHYSQKINDFMVKSFADNTCKVTVKEINLYQQKFLNLGSHPFAHESSFGT